MPPVTPLALACAAALGALTAFAPSQATAQLYNPCPFTNDGDCDEPNGLNLCAWGTDTVDCSNPNSYYGGGSGYVAGGGTATPPAGTPTSYSP